MRRTSILPVLGLVLLGSSLVPRDAGAIVLQINGVICPQTNNIVPGLNKGENGPPYTNTLAPPNVAGAGPKGPIDPIFDAAEVPQVFAVPKTNGKFNTVTFIDLLEGAGFENTFGWYNVGDDLSNLNNLHPVLTCTPINYEPTPAANSQATVNFEDEFLAGRYKGGPIGFFLVTPQGQSGSCSNCGDPKAAGGVCVGRIYYTEKAINGDGNYVHHLVYQTKRTNAAGKRLDDFYFGFEDLYRGGDNDFEDMLILVQGLVVPCTPSAEICDGLDNNCDGLIDNNPTDVGADCYTGPPNTVGKGECKAGKTVCASTGPGDKTIVCVGSVVPSAEVCDGKDNNCNGQVDENLNNLPNACPPQQGSCSASTQCVGGVPTCVPQKGPQPEICNGLDDDCNGLIDDKLTDIGVPCTPSGNDPTDGECKAGIFVCNNGVLSCSGYEGPKPELCDGKDNDCDGEIDDDPVDLLAKCAPSGVNVCTSGAELCIGGVKICAGFTLPSPEVCNGVDDDCNGAIDDNPVDAGALCGNSIGACEPGTLVCKPKLPGDPTSNELVCEGAVGPSEEICDGLDNNCNGFVDENADKLPGVGVPCGGAECGAGVSACKNGKLICETAGGVGTPEVCNGLDDDCNGLIDDNPTDAGQPCGTNVGECSQGKTICVNGKLDCEDQVGPSDEVCDGLDNNCNGVVDEDPDGAGPQTLPGTGEPCPPEGLTLPLKGECKPGKTVCLGGTFQCLGAIGPQAEICDGKDNDCDGVADAPDPCPGESKCIAGQCAQKCSIQGEFSNCPGGLDCIGGFCVKPGSGQGGSAGVGGSGTAGSSGQSTGGGGGGGAGQGGPAGQGAGGPGQGGSGGLAGGSGGGAASGGVVNGADSDGDGKPDSWGLTTGGGGCACSTAPDPSPGWLGVGLLGLLGGLLRGRRLGGKKEVA
jgi:Notch-like protein